jgi:hypothetical protein
VLGFRVEVLHPRKLRVQDDKVTTVRSTFCSGVVWPASGGITPKERGKTPPTAERKERPSAGAEVLARAGRLDWVVVAADLAEAADSAAADWVRALVESEWAQVVPAAHRQAERE